MNRQIRHRHTTHQTISITHPNVQPLHALNNFSFYIYQDRCCTSLLLRLTNPYAQAIFIFFLEKMDRAIERQRVLLEHLRPSSTSSSLENLDSSISVSSILVSISQLFPGLRCLTRSEAEVSLLFLGF